jgi:hypothetical protein
LAKIQYTIRKSNYSWPLKTNVKFTLLLYRFPTDNDGPDSPPVIARIYATTNAPPLFPMMVALKSMRDLRVVEERFRSNPPDHGFMIRSLNLDSRWHFFSIIGFSVFLHRLYTNNPHRK